MYVSFFQARFEQICKRALSSALRLVSKVADLDHGSLEKTYIQACNVGSFSGWGYEAYEDDEEILEATPPADDDECVQVVRRIDREKVFIDPDATLEQSLPGGDFMDAGDYELEGIVDKESMAAVLAAPPEDAEKDHVTAKCPCTLTEALDHATNAGDKVFWNQLWQLSISLRSKPGGMDTGFIPNPRHCRRASQGLNWHQWLGR